MLSALVVLMFFNGAMFARLAFKQVAVEPDVNIPVSVVICARNESERLAYLIPVILAQDHKEFEVVVVNYDPMKDYTWEMLQNIQPLHPRLRPVNIQADEKFTTVRRSP